MDTFSKIKGQAPKIIGSSFINHDNRVKLNLTCSEYVMMEYIYKCVKNNEEVVFDQMFINTGFTKEQQGILIRNLVEKGFVFPKETPIPLISDKWESVFPDIEKEFEEFWHEIIDGKRKAAWQGSKKDAFSKYKIIRKEISKELAFNQREFYFEFLNLEKKYRKFSRQRMMCSVFLGPQRRIFEDWANYGQEIKDEFESKEVVIAKPSKMTKEQFDKLHQ